MYLSLFAFSYASFWSIPVAKKVSRQIFCIALILYTVGFVFNVPIFDFMAKSITLVLIFVPPICCYAYFMKPIKHKIPDMIKASLDEETGAFTLTLGNNGKVRTLDLVPVKPVFLRFFFNYIESLVGYARFRKKR